MLESKRQKLGRLHLEFFQREYQFANRAEPSTLESVSAFYEAHYESVDNLKDDYDLTDAAAEHLFENWQLIPEIVETLRLGVPASSDDFDKATETLQILIGLNDKRLEKTRAEYDLALIGDAQETARPFIKLSEKEAQAAMSMADEYMASPSSHKYRVILDVMRELGFIIPESEPTNAANIKEIISQAIFHISNKIAEDDMLTEKNVGEAFKELLGYMEKVRTELGYTNERIL